MLELLTFINNQVICETDSFVDATVLFVLQQTSVPSTTRFYDWLETFDELWFRKTTKHETSEKKSVRNLRGKSN